MTLQEQMQINQKIMDLIKSKYVDSFPTGYNTPESRYYYCLERDTLLATKYESMESSRVQRS